MSYLVSVSGQDSPLANTLRFTLRFTFGNSPVQENETAE